MISLFGVTCIQACVYFKRNSQDTTQLKFIVSAINQPVCLELAECRRLLHWCQAVCFSSQHVSPLNLVTSRLLESLHIAFLTHGIYVCGITNHGGFHCFQNAVW